ncbi:MAG TPA: polymer-forming cytoskeletal protein, partial [Acidimicrobiia bacterium]|nr:polymer-forming cytoskeletal protein [Acidimicrobiia bacterium]
MDPQNPRTIARVFDWPFKGMRWWFRRSVGLAAILGLSLVILAPGAVAQDDNGPDSDDHVVLTGGLVVPEGETAKTAVVFNGDVLIDGTLTETLVVFNGRTEITGTVAEDVIVFNGAVVLRSGSRVEGDVVSRRSPQIEEGATVGGSVDNLPTRWDYWDITFVGRLGWWLAYTVSTLVLGLVLLMLARGLDPASIRALRDRLGATIGF